jgi:hypothetical protein
MRGIVNALLAVKPIDIVIVVAAGLIVLAVIGYSVWRKKTGKGGCGCGCKGCPSADKCNANKKEK